MRKQTRRTRTSLSSSIQRNKRLNESVHRLKAKLRLATQKPTILLSELKTIDLEGRVLLVASISGKQYARLPNIVGNYCLGMNPEASRNICFVAAHVAIDKGFGIDCQEIEPERNYSKNMRMIPVESIPDFEEAIENQLLDNQD